MKVAFVTLGCRANQSESDIIKESLELSGVTTVTLNDSPDFCIVNTCTVTRKSDYTSRQLIRKAAKQGAKVIVTGCYSQLNEQEVAGLPGVVKIVDIKNKYDIVGLITHNTDSKLVFATSSRSRPFLKIQDGCNFSCSYCTVPLARGKSRSEPLELLIERAAAIVEKGFSEIVLTGIHLGTYGKDLPDQASISGLLRTLLLQTSIHRIRLSSLEVNEINDELLEVVEDKRLCENLHIPLQSGSDAVLRLMRRGYNAGQFRKKIEAVAERLGRIGLGTDIIVGFPGESDRDFEETYQMLEDLPFTYMHVFPYSPRLNTDAAQMTGLPTFQKVQERIDRLKWLENAKKTTFMKEQIGKSLEIIMEEGEVHGMVVGTSSNYLKVAVPLYEQHRGSVEIAHLVGIRNNMLEGHLVKVP
ncbi:MAG: tRNA (N(6)-L-threonylcarbamoyladenosine(37)-C(2))-methylthiotransferase MtaB [Thermodesulfovibrio sp.]|nr:tRNA (N(6)-L-threonylcarbamoyladenosine(37)-C(2))-methylthiotransferase MtaB [Thermodesulfovibrio sp.]